MELFLPIAVVFISAILAPFAERWLKSAVGWILAIIPFLSFLHYLSMSLLIGSGESIATGLRWIPSLGLNLTFYLDGLSLLMLLLVTGIGALVLIYSGYYMKKYDQKRRFYLYLMLFMGSMMGLVLSGNLLGMFVFWELTSVSSYLLIGFFHEKGTSRAAALQALLITVLGGLALLAGIVLIYLVTGTVDIVTLLSEPDVIKSHPYYMAILILVLAGAFTKSAQFPFHFWLPGAMAGPSPVSAFLHSATMVKAGVFLLLRLNPVLGGTPEWSIILSVVGGLTMLIGAYFSLSQTDLKRILAYTTISALGMLVLLTGINTTEAIKAAIIFLVVHSLYKGALFMIAGSIDKQAGTRELYQLGGLARNMPFTTAAALVALLSMAGLPPFIGFIGKELIYEAKIAVPDAAQFVLIAGILSNVFMVAISAIFGWQVFFAGKSYTSETPHETPVRLWLGPAVLAVFSLLLGLFPNFFANNIAGPAIAAVKATDIQIKLKLWHGFNQVLLLSIITVVGGMAIFAFRKQVLPILSRVNGLLIRFSFSEKFMALIEGFLKFTKKKTDIVQSGVQRFYLMVIFLVTSGFVWYQLFYTRFWEINFDFGPMPYYLVGLSVIMIAASLLTVFTKSRLTAILSMGVVGWGVALLFAFYGAVDLAITQVMVETLIVVLFVMIIYHLPSFKNLSSRASRIRDAFIAVIFGSFMTGLTLKADFLDFYPGISEYFGQNSYTAAKGRNIVNVILVDFRAMDTLGEITVLVIAAIGVFSLMRLKIRKQKKQPAK